MDEESTSKRTLEGEHVGETKRHASEAERSGMNLVRTTRPNEKPQSYRGGIRVPLSANFFRLPKTPEWTIYKYHTTFEPECLLIRLKNAMIAQHKDQIGGFIFDGVQLFVTRELSNEIVILESRARDETVYKITCKFTKVVSPNSRDYIQVLNLILRRANAALNWKLVNRSYYDADAMIDLSQFKLQLWPGFETTIQNYRNDILVNCDVIHKAMRTDTVYSIMKEVFAKDRNNFQNTFKQEILGKTVLTDYNNQTYCIDDIDFDINPDTTFKKGDRDISIRDYYAEKYQKEIHDLKQPILISKLKDRSLRGGIQRGPIWLVPELCRMTGLSEKQRNDITLKNAMKPYSQMIPKIRRQRILDFNNRVQTKPTSIGVITEWNLGLDREMVRIDGYRIGPEFLRFADGQQRQVSNANWNRECGPNMRVYQTASLKRWYVVYPRQMEKEMTKFVRRVMEIGRKMNFHIATPRAEIVSHDRELASKVNELVNSQNPQMLFFGVAGNKNSNADTYAAIKKRCFAENAIASQVATNYVLSRDKGYDSIITKIAIQMCTKLGGAPWTIHIPVRGVMTIGFDVSKDTQNKSLSFGCMVATMDLQESANFFVHVTSYSNTETLAKEFGIGVRKAIDAWLVKYKSLPRKIVIYRGGISDGELSYLVDVEVKLIEGRLKEIYESQGADMQLAFIVVTKKVNARIFEDENNPQPGTVVDDVITLSERYEFYLVSQSCTQGTVSPTNYNIIYDNFDDNWQIDRFAIWSYKQTHLYYNWTGTTRVPAPLLYSSKLCFMVSNFLHQAPSSGLENSLYFL